MSLTRSGIRALFSPLAWLVAAVHAPYESVAYAQQAQVLPGASVCANCEVRAERRFVLTTPRTATDLITDKGTPYVRRDRLGRFLVRGSGGGILVFDSLGQFQTSVLRSGSGPGEIPVGAVLFFEPGPQNLNVLLSSHLLALDIDFRELHKSPLPRVPMAGDRVALADGSYLLSGWDRGASGSNAQQRFLVTHAEPGTPRFSSWELSTRSSNSGCSPCSEFSIAAARSASEFWALGWGDYQLERWTTSGGGRLLNRYRVEGAPWYERARRDWLSDVSQRIRLLPRVPQMDLRERTDGLLVVVSRGVREYPTQQLSLGPQPTLLDIYLAAEAFGFTQIDVIDTSRGLLGSTRLEARDLRLIDDRFAFRFQYDSAGVVEVEIWEITLINSRLILEHRR